MLPATAYALLGLLSLQPWTTYELAQQLRRSLRWFFSRAERGAYTAIKRLAAEGLADASTIWTGRRRSTVYRITPAGRAALRGWLDQPSPPVTFEAEALVRVFFSDQGSTEALLTTLEEVRAHATGAVVELTAMARESAAGTAPFPERGRRNALSMRLGLELHRTVARWAADSADEVRAWPEADADPEAAGRAAFERLLVSLEHGT